MKSHAVRIKNPLKLNESMISKARENKDLTVEDAAKKYEEKKQSSLDFAINYFLQSDFCKKIPKTVDVLVRDYKGDIIKDRDGRDVYTKGTVYSYNYNNLTNAISRVLKRFRPDELPKGVFLKIKFEDKEKNLDSKNTIFLYKFPTGEVVAKCSKLSDKDIENLKEDSIICTYWVKRIILFYLKQRLKMSDDEIKESAQMLYKQTADMAKDIINESMVHKINSVNKNELNNQIDNQINPYNSLVDKLIEIRNEMGGGHLGMEESRPEFSEKLLEMFTEFLDLSNPNEIRAFAEDSFEPLTCIESLSKLLLENIRNKVDEEYKKKIDENLELN